MTLTSKEKNIEEVICNTKKLISDGEKVKLIIVGDGPQKDSLKNLVYKLGIDNNVIFTGEVNFDSIQNYYALGNVFVCASQSETQGLTYIEALAAGKPILARKDPCLDNVLISGKNGYAYTNEDEFCKEYKYLFAKDAYIGMASLAKDSVKKLSSNKFGTQMELIYKKVLSHNSELNKENLFFLHSKMPSF